MRKPFSKTQSKIYKKINYNLLSSLLKLAYLTLSLVNSPFLTLDISILTLDIL